MPKLRTVATMAVAVTLLLTGGSGFGQSALTEHTYRLDDDGQRPAATLDDVAWLVGAWRGEVVDESFSDAFGDSFEEFWNPPSAGTMVGMFKLLRDGEVAFYELMILAEEAGSLTLKVRHFGADFSAWEDKDEYADFPLVMADAGALHFRGYSFYRLDDDTAHAYLAMRRGDEIHEEKLIYRRIPSP
jgi:hypothetical protein